MKKILSVFILILSVFAIIYSYPVVITEEAPGHKYPAISNIEHALLDSKGESISLKSTEVKTLSAFAKERYLAEWRTKFILIVFSIITGLFSLVVFLERKKE